MKKSLFLFGIALIAMNIMADDGAELTFKQKEHNFGVIAQDTCVVSCTFTFTNTGNQPLVIHQAISSCGCTVPEYTMEPIAPGKSGVINVTYNGKTKRPGVFKKSITVHTNAINTPTRIYIEGEMIASDNIEELVPVQPTEVIQESAPQETLSNEAMDSKESKVLKKATNKSTKKTTKKASTSKKSNTTH